MLGPRAARPPTSALARCQRASRPRSQLCDRASCKAAAAVKMGQPRSPQRLAAIESSAAPNDRLVAIRSVTAGAKPPMPPPEVVSPVADCVWEIPPSWQQGMRVPVRVYASENCLPRWTTGVRAGRQRGLLPGIVEPASACRTATGATASRSAAWPRWIRSSGVISPGGIGFDINCGMRLVLTNLTSSEVRPRLRELVDALFSAFPRASAAQVSCALSRGEFREVLAQGSPLVRASTATAWPEDLELTEEGGCFAGADPAAVSARAIERGRAPDRHPRLRQPLPRDPGGASGEHLRRGAGARAFGITIPNQVVIMFHCGSRGFGHQVATDYLQTFLPRDDGQVRNRASSTGNWPARRSALPRGRPTSPP